MHCVHIFFHIKVLELFLRTDCKFLEKIEILSDVFVSLCLGIEKSIFVSVSQYVRRVVGLPFYTFFISDCI